MKGDDAMAIIYVAHAYDGDKYKYQRAKRITHELQEHDVADCFLCPVLMFSHIGGNLADENTMELRLDVLSVCDRLIVASTMDAAVQTEVDFANLVGMEVEWIEED